MGIGSWARFLIGIVLAAGIVSVAMFGGEQSGMLVPLSVLYLALTVLWVVKKLALGL